MSPAGYNGSCSCGWSSSDSISNYSIGGGVATGVTGAGVPGPGCEASPMLLTGPVYGPCWGDAVFNDPLVLK